MRDRVAMVTGSSRGIGRAVSLRLAQQGAAVVACARDKALLDELAEESRRREFPGVIDARVLDVTDAAAIEALVASVSDQTQRIDILVNNAGITRDGLLLNMDDRQFEDVLTTNLRSAFWLTRAVSRLMVRQRYGRIINMASVSGVMGNAGQANYAAAKAGLIGLTKSTARELAKRNITCNAVAPGFIETDMTKGLPDKVKEAYRQLIPAGRFGQAEEIAEVVAFLAGEGASYVTGQVILVDGGMRM